MSEVNAIVAGAGIWGCTVARVLAERGRKVLVLEKRAAPGGNVRCADDPETGIEIHSYGSHIFHTHDDAAWDFVRRCIEFNGYQHKVLARHAGKTYFLPIGLALVNSFFGVELKPSEVEAFMADETHRKALFDAFVRGYTSKQWGVPPEEVDPAVIKRLVVRSSYDINYFPDVRQGIPLSGYNSLFDRLLEHPNIALRCGVDWLEWRKGEGAALDGKVPTFYSGPLDALFDYQFGALPWRSLRFELERLDVADFQGTSVMNYADAEIPYTRIHEFKHYHPERKDIMALGKTVIMREYSKTWKPGDEPYYPVNTPASQELVARYREEAAKIPNLVLGGRLGEYKYYDMDQSVSRALAAADAIE